MGTTLSRVRGAVITRPLQRFHIEPRTDRILDRDQKIPRSAPKHPSDEDTLKLVRKAYPNLSKEVHSKNTELYDRLKQVYVESTDVQEFDPDSLKQVENPDRPKPKQRFFKPEDYEGSDDPYATHHPFTRPDGGLRAAGKLTLAEIQEILTRLKESRGSLSASQIAEEKLVDQELVEGLFRHYSIFSLMEKDREEKSATEKIKQLSMWEEIDEKGNVVKPSPWKIENIATANKFRDRAMGINTAVKSRIALVAGQKDQSEKKLPPGFHIEKKEMR